MPSKLKKHHDSLADIKGIRECRLQVTIRTIAYCRVGKKAVPLQPIYKPY